MARGRQKQGDTKGLKAATGVETVCIALYLANANAQPPLQPLCPVCHSSGPPPHSLFLSCKAPSPVERCPIDHPPLTWLTISYSRRFKRCAFITAWSAGDTCICCAGACTATPGSDTISLSSLAVQAAWKCGKGRKKCGGAV